MAIKEQENERLKQEQIKSINEKFQIERIKKIEEKTYKFDSFFANKRIFVNTFKDFYSIRNAKRRGSDG